MESWCPGEGTDTTQNWMADQCKVSGVSLLGRATTWVSSQVPVISLGPLLGLLGIFWSPVFASGAVISVLADRFLWLACLYLWGEHPGLVLSSAQVGIAG